MFDLHLALSIAVALLWLVTLVLPWYPWQNNERLEPESQHADIALDDVTVIIPARNEALCIATTLQSLADQGPGLKTILVDDESTDATATIAENSGLKNLNILQSSRLPSSWTGKLWAQEQGFRQVKTAYTLLLDADIALQPGVIQSLRYKMQQQQLHFISLMALLRCQTLWEKLLMPAFIYFFKLLYPFALSNKPDSRVAAAAGGCILVSTAALKEIGGMQSIKDAIIDDCSLAKKIKTAGYKTWIGLSKSVISQRPYNNLNEIWEMVARTAYTQLYYSLGMLFICTGLMLLLYGLPVQGIFNSEINIVLINLTSIFLMCLLFQPTLKFYSLNPLWAITLPITATLYLLMTWSSAIRYWQGERTRWKGRTYQKI